MVRVSKCPHKKRDAFFGAIPAAGGLPADESAALFVFVRPLRPARRTDLPFHRILSARFALPGGLNSRFIGSCPPAERTKPGNHQDFRANKAVLDIKETTFLKSAAAFE